MRNRCRSWRIKSFRIVRCAWAADHVRRTKWHCAENSTRHIWLVKDKERP